MRPNISPGELIKITRFCILNGRIVALSWQWALFSDIDRQIGSDTICPILQLVETIAVNS